MRWLFLLVLTLNLGYFAWQSSLSESGSDIKAMPIKGVEPIVLLSEIGADDVLLVESAVDEPASSSASAVSESSEPESSVSEEVVVEQVENVPANVESSKPVAAAAPPEAASPEPASIKPAAAEKKEIVVSSAPQCYSLGPFRDLDKLRRLTRDIKSYVTKTDFRGKEEKEQTLYWVYIKPEKSHASALATAKRLKAKKIKDYYVIQDGEKAHGVSLGHFRNKQGAYGLAKRVTRLGFNVLVEPVYKTYTLYWLDYQLVNGKKVPKSVLVKYVEQDKNNKINILERSCSPV